MLPYRLDEVLVRQHVELSWPVHPLKGISNVPGLVVICIITALAERALIIIRPDLDIVMADADGNHAVCEVRFAAKQDQVARRKLGKEGPGTIQNFRLPAERLGIVELIAS